MNNEIINNNNNTNNNNNFQASFQTREGSVFQEGRDVVTIGEWTDRIYQNTPQEHIITNVVSGRKMRIQKYNFPDTGKLPYLLS